MEKPYKRHGKYIYYTNNVNILLVKYCKTNIMWVRS